MKIRVFQLMSNYYKDRSECDDTQETEDALGEYCCFGYFDALRKKRECELDDKNESIWHKLEEIALEDMDGRSSCKNLVCYIESSQKDKEFWEEAEEKPFLFMTLVRISLHEKNNIERLEQLIDKYNSLQNDTIAYYSTGHCEAVILYACNKYSSGFEHVQVMRSELKYIKLYTVFTVQESTLENEERINQSVEDEYVCCRLRTVVKDEVLLRNFIGELVEVLDINKDNMRLYDVFGACDVIIELKKICLSKMLLLYKHKGLLTHFNSSYKEALFNIESEFMLERRDENGKVVAE